MVYIIVQHPKKNAEHTIVVEECLGGELYSVNDVVKMYVGKSYQDKPPAEIMKVKNKTAPYSGPGFYWRKIVSLHGKF
jgi:hypothetical protein